jgi:hypothetical protein
MSTQQKWNDMPDQSVSDLPVAWALPGLSLYDNRAFCLSQSNSNAEDWSPLLAPQTIVN